LSTNNAAGSSAAVGAGLHRRVLTSNRVFGQAMAGISPTTGAVTMVPLAFGLAGSGAWLTVLICTAAMMAVGICISRVVSSRVSSGAMYSMIPLGLGNGGGLLGGMLMLGITAIVGPFLVIAVGSNLSTFLASVHVATVPAWGIDLIEIACLIVLGLLAIADIRLSTQVFLILELASMALVTILLVIIVVHRGTVIDTSQFKLQGATPKGIMTGLGFLVLSFAGFEGCASLGLEARKPRSAVRIALIWSVLAAGIFFVLNAYVEVLGFRGVHLNLATQTAPLNTLADQAGVGWLGSLVVLGVTISWFAATGGWYNYASRVMFTMARDGILPAGLGKTSRKSGAPTAAILLIGAVWIAGQIYISIANVNQGTAFGDMGSLVGYCFAALYLLVALSVILWVYQQKAPTVTVLVAGLVTIAAMGVFFYYSFSPFPAFPISAFAIAFFALVAIPLIVALVVRLTGSGYLKGVGRTAETPAEEAVPEPVVR
jgi:amino acid transporter